MSGLCSIGCGSCCYRDRLALSCDWQIKRRPQFQRTRLSCSEHDMTNRTNIFVALLGEGTDVWRPHLPRRSAVTNLKSLVSSRLMRPGSFHPDRVYGAERNALPMGQQALSHMKQLRSNILRRKARIRRGYIKTVGKKSLCPPYPCVSYTAQ